MIIISLCIFFWFFWLLWNLERQIIKNLIKNLIYQESRYLQRIYKQIIPWIVWNIFGFKVVFSWFKWVFGGNVKIDNLQIKSSIVGILLPVSICSSIKTITDFFQRQIATFLIKLNSTSSIISNTINFPWLSIQKNIHWEKNSHKSAYFLQSERKTNNTKKKIEANTCFNTHTHSFRSAYDFGCSFYIFSKNNEIICSKATFKRFDTF